MFEPLPTLRLLSIALFAIPSHCLETLNNPKRTMMRAVVLEEPGPPENLKLKEIPVPVPTAGQVLIRVRAFGLNRSEHHTRLGLAGDAVTFPRVLGIEAVGQVEACPGGEYKPGQHVCAMMGGMGRSIDGGYAQYTCVPVTCVVPFSNNYDPPLEWSVLGAIPEMLQTSNGSLTIGLNAKAGQSILIRGGTSSVGMATAVLAKLKGMTVISTTRNPNKTDALKKIGVDHVVVDTTGTIADQVRELNDGQGVDCALELVGTPTLQDTLRCCKVHGITCFTGMLSNRWIVKDFYPIDYIPTGVCLTSYGGNASDLPKQVLQEFLDAVAAGQATVPIHKVYRMDDIVEAHKTMEAGSATGKLVVLTD